MFLATTLLGLLSSLSSDDDSCHLYYTHFPCDQACLSTTATVMFSPGCEVRRCVPRPRLSVRYLDEIIFLCSIILRCSTGTNI
ncbi:hypothetical protein F4677DRAFT_427261 [Hypoxylon crocopeplum]|nr:hypothetical protein F4677DRAFT_427261 [Hypoxylon crocopeplum]